MPDLEQKLFVEETGAESEDDASTPTADQIRQAFITGSDWTTETIVNQLRKGNIDLNPAFQRREVWTPTRKSSLIESIVLNLPVPQIVLAERKDQPSTYIVLDGKQRLLAIRQFCVESENPLDAGFDALHLVSLTLRPDLNGETHETIAGNVNLVDVVNAFDNHTIRTVVIRNWPDSDYLHRVFLRLNTGSVPLSPQELRQALIPGPFTDFLDQFATQSEPLQRALGIEGPDFRMRDNEILLRYMAFAYSAGNYGGNLKRFLDEAASTLNKDWPTAEQSIRDAASECEAAIVATEAIFGRHDSFSTYNGSAFEGRFNRAVFDIMTYYFSDAAVRTEALKARIAVKKAFMDRSKTDASFFQALTTTTKSKGATAARFSAWADELSHATSLVVAAPPNFTQVLAT